MTNERWFTLGIILGAAAWWSGTTVGAAIRARLSRVSGKGDK